MDLEELINAGIRDELEVAAAKIDLAKCFDTVVIQQCIQPFAAPRGSLLDLRLTESLLREDETLHRV